VAKNIDNIANRFGIMGRTATTKLTATGKAIAIGDTIADLIGIPMAGVLKFSEKAGGGVMKSVSMKSGMLTLGLPASTLIPGMG